jgi:hypothetical protein
MRSALVFLFLTAHLAIAQPIAIGVEGGLKTTGDVSGTLNPESPRYIVGPKVELRLPLHLSLEVDALYRDIGFTGYSESCCTNFVTRERDSSWEFPIQVKYRFPTVARLHPFVGIGYASRIVSGHDTFFGTMENVQTGAISSVSGQNSVSYPATQGLVVSGGVEFGPRHLSFSPELRYVHWNAPFLNENGGNGSSRYASPQDELFVLVGIALR